jgi:GalNAc-alpha-(1->4)-GalNAc-alpha-(1->3)-diNAcBac-PP-undecaprenol alpha-1,4-N-acetyl-D-galactosaminyltransferase
VSRALNITLVAPSLGVGGAERVVQLLARGFDRRRHRVSVITTSTREDFYELPKSVPRIPVHLTGVEAGRGTAPREMPRAAARVIANLPRLRRIIASQSPDVVISFMNQVNVITLVAAARRWQVVVTEHSDPRPRRVSLAMRALQRLAYPHALCLVSVSRGVDRGFEWVPHEQRVVIHNPIDIPRENVAQNPLPSGLAAGQFAVALGRLKYEKGFDLLIEAFELVRRRYPGWRLAIIGDGPERASLEGQIRTRRLGDAVVLLGLQKDPWSYLRTAGLFVLSSRWEGFGNVLAEAMCCGLPVVSFDCHSGPSEIITDGENGVLVPPGDVGKLAEAMSRLIADPALRTRLAAQALVSSRRFHLDRIAEQWEQRVFSRLGAVVRQLR